MVMVWWTATQYEGQEKDKLGGQCERKTKKTTYPAKRSSKKTK
jgi:hypothetical protein